MHSYTNRKGEIVTVSDEHLQTAVRIKIELQKASPSRRCSWALHKKLMEKEGFDDSDTNESYRCLVKNYQRSIGALPSAQKYAEIVADGKLEAIKELVGELAWEKRENQNILRELNKTKREVIDNGLLISNVVDSVKNVFGNIDFGSMSNHSFNPIKAGKARIIPLLTDWHIGALVNIKENKYNYEVAKRRMNQFLDYIYTEALNNNASMIDLVYLGDLIEHAYMRASQPYNAEFPVSQQIVRGAELIIEMIWKLQKEFFVSYRGIAGNHDRFEGDKKKTIDGDNAMVIANAIIRTFINSIGDNAVYYESNSYDTALLNVYGRNFKFVHGDREKANDLGKIYDHSAKDGIIYDAIIMGHFHHYEVIEVAKGRYEAKIGSLKGTDEYTVSLGHSCSPSQGIIIVKENGDFEIKQVILD